MINCNSALAMTPDRRRQIEALYHAVLKGGPDERATLLKQADPELRAEVEALLSGGSESAHSTVTQLNAASHPGTCRTPAQAAETRLGPYKIQALIGAGGMGEVYLAHDARLDRRVAIKVLPAHLAADPVARVRLRREAMSAAALDHPFICKVFEIGEDGGALFIVMEFVGGETLHQRLLAGRLPLAEALRIAGEVRFDWFAHNLGRDPAICNEARAVAWVANEAFGYDFSQGADA